ncbi:MAG: hypothetical protein GY801_11510 [bacterium]|nr:hypothetical protein [bacterium]
MIQTAIAQDQSLTSENSPHTTGHTDQPTKNGERSSSSVPSISFLGVTGWQWIGLFGFGLLSYLVFGWLVNLLKHLNARRSKWLVLGGTLSTFMGVWGISSPVCAVVPLNDNLSLIQYTDSFQPFWEENGEFSQHVAQAVREQYRHHHHFTKQTDLALSNTLNRLTKKIRFAVSPRAVIKPFMIVREFQTVLQVYQSKQLRKKIQVDENFQAKTMLVPNHNTTQLLHKLKQSLSRTFSVSPYQRRIYGLHFQITW